MNHKRKIRNGQRWISKSEPELGLGTVVENTNGRIKIHFSTSNVTRLYSGINAPIKRIHFKPGDSLIDKNGNTFIVDRVHEENELLFYADELNKYCETELADTINLNSPVSRLLSFDFDTIEPYNLRYNTLLLQERRLKSPYRGFCSARINLIPHQLFIADEVSGRYAPRVILSDEVGLGKTIEAALIINKLQLSNRVKSVLIIAPEHLLLQWYCELFHRFNITSSIIDRKHYAAQKKKNNDLNPFTESQICICSYSLINSNKQLQEMSLNMNWDMVLVDEAHNILEASEEYGFFKELSQLTDGLMLLTAVPEHANLDNFFGLLHLIDPGLYSKYEDFFWKINKYTFIANIASGLIENRKLNNEQLQFLKENFPPEYNKNSIIINNKIELNKSDRKLILYYLIDQHGLGRTVFRNTRKNVGTFPERKVALIPLENDHRDEKISKAFYREFEHDITDPDHAHVYNFDNDCRVKWLLSFLKERSREKTLIICTSKNKVSALGSGLKGNGFTDFRYIHEDCELMERDKRVLAFSRENGPVLLISSEIGSEGRNFQFCKNLVFFDMPFNPSVIEQRIGRLDRIGQKNKINIYIPYPENSPQSVLIKWFHEGLNIFKEFSGGLNQIFSVYNDFIKKTALANNHDELQSIILKTKKDYRKIINRNEKGKDKLIEINSYNKEKADKIICNIQYDDNRQLENYIIRFFEYYGFRHEQIDKRTYVLTPADLKTDAFPGISKDGLAVTFDRNIAIKREDYAFIADDHYLVDRAVELVLQQNTGNCAFAIWPGNEKKDLILEVIYILECVAPLELNLNRYLSVTPVRILVNKKLDDLSDQFPFALIDEEIMEYNRDEYESIQPVIEKESGKMLAKAELLAGEKASEIKKKAVLNMKTMLEKEITRLEILKRVNESIKEEEIAHLKHKLKMLEKYILSSRLRMDSIRIIRKV